MSQLGQMRVVGLPAFGIEQAFSLRQLHPLRALTDVHDNAADLV